MNFLCKINKCSTRLLSCLKINYNLEWTKPTELGNDGASFTSQVELPKKYVILSKRMKRTLNENMEKIIRLVDGKKVDFVKKEGEYRQSIQTKQVEKKEIQMNVRRLKIVERVHSELIAILAHNDFKSYVLKNLLVLF